MKPSFSVWIGSLALAIFAAGAEVGRPQSGDPAAEDREAIAPAWNAATRLMGSVGINAADRSVVASGWVNQVEGAIELFACGPGGKTHETTFVLNVNPLDLQAGLLLVGLKAGAPMRGLGQGPPSGDGVAILVEWEKDGRLRRDPAESFVHLAQECGTLEDSPWIFNGSVLEDGEFKALAEESLVATYWDPWAIVNLSHPCGSNDEVWAVNDATIPPLKTPVNLIFKAR